MVDSQRLERAQSVIEGLEVLTNILQVLVDIASLGHVETAVPIITHLLFDARGADLHEDQFGPVRVRMSRDRELLCSEACSHRGL